MIKPSCVNLSGAVFCWLTTFGFKLHSFSAQSSGCWLKMWHFADGKETTFFCTIHISTFYLDGSLWQDANGKLPLASFLVLSVSIWMSWKWVLWPTRRERHDYKTNAGCFLFSKHCSTERERDGKGGGGRARQRGRVRETHKDGERNGGGGGKREMEGERETGRETEGESDRLLLFSYSLQWHCCCLVWPGSPPWYLNVKSGKTQGAGGKEGGGAHMSNITNDSNDWGLIGHRGEAL